jgi:ABC-type amino acid transport substrate-binding protein
MVADENAINTIDDLKGQSVATFHGAENVLSDFEEITRNIKSLYIAENSMQAAHLMKAKRAFAYLGDYVAFYYALRIKYSEDVAKQYSRIIHYFDKTDQLICYKDPGLTEQFNDAFQRLDKAGKITAIISKYVELPKLATE